MVMPSKCPFCGNEIGDCRPIGGCEICYPRIPDPPGLLRCEITGNECGTDTWHVDHPCQCTNCQKYLKNKEPYRLEDSFPFFKENIE